MLISYTKSMRSAVALTTLIATGTVSVQALKHDKSLVKSVTFNGYSLQLDCGPKGAHMLDPLPPLTIKVGQAPNEIDDLFNGNESQKIGIMDALKILCKDDKSMTPFINAISLYKSGNGNGDILSPFYNLLVQSILLLRSNLDFQTVLEEVTILCARYKLTLQEKEQPEKGDLAKTIISLKEFFTEDDDKEKSKKKNTTKPTETDIQKMYNWFATQEHKLELSTQEAKDLAKTGSDKLTLKDRLTILGRLISKALHNMHNKLADKHKTLMNGTDTEAITYQNKVNTQLEEHYTVLSFKQSPYGSRLTELSEKAQLVEAKYPTQKGDLTGTLENLKKVQEEVKELCEKESNEVTALMHKLDTTEEQTGSAAAQILTGQSASAESNKIYLTEYQTILAKSIAQLKQRVDALDKVLGEVPNLIKGGNKTPLKDLGELNTDNWAERVKCVRQCAKQPLALPGSSENFLDKIAGLSKEIVFGAQKTEFAKTLNKAFTDTRFDAEEKDVCYKALATYAPGLFA